ncbi:MAG TPA: hypothetical protein PL041_13485 [Melioribacteraceae bacterium]|nr:hypothetical protein [Melioribacteraceae bacterium]
MLKKIIVLLFVFFTVNCSPSFKGNDTPEHLGKTIYNAFLNNKIDEFKKYIMTADDYIKMLDSTNFSEKKKQAYIEKYKQDIPLLFEQTLQNFEDVKKEAKNLNINFKEAKFEKIEYRGGKAEIFNYMYINIVFYSNNKKYLLRLNDCYLTQRGWLIAGIVFLIEYPEE